MKKILKAVFITQIFLFNSINLWPLALSGMHVRDIEKAMEKKAKEESFKNIFKKIITKTISDDERNKYFNETFIPNENKYDFINKDKWWKKTELLFLYITKIKKDKDKDFEFKNLNDIVFILNNAGDFLRKKGEYSYGIKLVNIALLINKENNFNKASSYNNLGLFYMEHKNYKKALENFELSLNMKLDGFEGKKFLESCVYNNLGALYDDQKDYKKSIEYYNEALNKRLCKFGEDSLYVAEIYHNLGIVYYEKEDYEKSIEYYNKELDIRLCKFGKDSLYVAESYSNLGIVYNGKKEYKKAIEYCNEALNISLNKKSKIVNILRKNLKEVQKCFLNSLEEKIKIYKNKNIDYLKLDGCLKEKSIFEILTIGIVLNNKWSKELSIKKLQKIIKGVKTNASKNLEENFLIKIDDTKINCNKKEVYEFLFSIAEVFA